MQPALRFPAAVVPLILLAASSATLAAPVAVQFDAADGLVLRGSYWAAAKPGPAMLLLHQCNMDHTSWGPLASALAESGMHVLAFDFRGFGGSRSERVGEFAANSGSQWPAFPGDVDRAVEHLKSLSGVDAGRLGVLGASCGGTQALLLARRNPAVKAFGLLSSSLPRLSPAEAETPGPTRTVPLLIVAAERDTGTYERSLRLFSLNVAAESKLVVYKGELHGVPLFTHDPGLVPEIVAWYKPRL